MNPIDILGPLGIAGAFVVGVVGTLLVLRRRESRALRMIPFLEEVRVAGWLLADKGIEKALQAYHTARVLDRPLPTDFSWEIFQSARVGHEIEHAVMLKAAQLGLLPAGWPVAHDERSNVTQRVPARRARTGEGGPPVPAASIALHEAAPTSGMRLEVVAIEEEGDPFRAPAPKAAATRPAWGSRESRFGGAR
jgi:hypothetical protein